MFGLAAAWYLALWTANPTYETCLAPACAPQYAAIDDSCDRDIPKGKDAP